ncbi:MAG: biotin transporter BioY [Acidobacteriaceae bacterium]
MNLTSAASPALAPRTRTWLRHAGLAISGSLLVAIAAHISVPLFFTPVPFTLQPLAVLAIGLLMGPSIGFSALMLYLLEGVSGLPVFSPAGPGGIAQILGPTGGYLMSFPLAAFAAGWLYRRARQSRFFSSFSAAIAAAAIGDVLLLTAGAAWLATLTHLAPAKIAALAIVPFLPGDALKVIAAAAIVTGIARVRKSHTVAE